MKKDTLDKLIERLDQLDRGELQNFLMHLARQKGLFKEVFEAIREGLLLLDHQGSVIYANQAASKLFDKEAKDLTRADVDTLVGNDKNVDTILNNGIAISHDIEITYPEHRFLNLYFAPISDDNAAFVILIRDVTREHANKEEILETEQLNALTLLAAGVAHEIGNPLNSIGLHLQLIQRKINSFSSLSSGENGMLNELTQTAINETRRLDTILKQFLQAIRPTRLDKEPMRIDPVIHEILDVLKPEMESRNIKVDLSLEENSPLIALDPTQIKQAIYNLIKNAYQAMPADGGQIMIHTQYNAYEVALSVVDSGCGISPEVMGSIYEPFLTTKKSGTGLGLLIVRRIVKEHGGNMTIASQQGHGTTITLVFPRYDKPRNLLAENRQP